ncbi:MAG: pilus assembly protein TadG-related protein [Pseudomonadota bacterium]|nr:pilus assembly protein TadG-related protein [Pseudomonadota bacterium]MEE3099356.1 pilus assembly protein TadG-related protein [Pseudomonadota bacterium]
MRVLRRIARRRAALRRFVVDQAASGSIMSVLWLSVFVMFMGVAVDVSNAYRVRAQLQATADAAALAAIQRISNPDEARAAARRLAAINMPTEVNGDVMPAAMVELGLWDEATDSFYTLGIPPYNAVRVTAKRGDDGGLAVPTFLLGLLHNQDWTIAASSTATVRPTTANPGGNKCGGGMLMSETTMQMGGNNTLTDGICVHGREGVHFGGSSFFTADVRVSAFDPNTITIGHVDDGSATEEQVKVPEAEYFEPVVLPKLNDIFADLWTALYDSGVSTYSGPLIPDFIYNAQGYANVVRINQWWWTVQPGDLSPNTIYVVNHGMQLAGKVDAQNIAIIAKGQIGMGGGPSLLFDKVLIFGEGDLNFSGSASYGEADHYCDDGEFDVYMFSKTRVSLGGSDPKAWTHAFMAVAPQFHPGGSFKNGGGIYVEARDTLQLGGNAEISGCDTDMGGHYETITVEDDDQVTFIGALVR